ncbi:MAG: hypothetical protein HUJ30_01415 [Gammaproteobacteria bacterium]|nr:hypothetical protein [Gammaproteobacteria bacterium]
MKYLIEILNILAWPGALVLLGYLFRKELNEAVLIHFRPQPQKIAYRISSTLSVAEEASIKMMQPYGGISDMHKSEIYTDSHDSLERLAKKSPRAAILETWVELEQTILDMVSDSEVVTRGPRACRRVIEKLVESKKIPEEVFLVYQTLREVRNKATYVPDYSIEKSDAERYIELYLASAYVLSQSMGFKPVVSSIGKTFFDQ